MSIKRDIRNKPLAYIIQIVGIIMVLLNLWIASKLAPIAEDLAVVVTRVESIETTIVPRTEIEAKLDDHTQRLNRIEDKLDRHLELINER
jgi:hypothetical protein